MRTYESDCSHYAKILTLVVTYSADKAETGHIDPNFTRLIYHDGAWPLLC